MSNGVLSQLCNDSASAMKLIYSENDEHHSPVQSFPTCSYFLVPINFVYKKHITISAALFLRMLFYYVNHSKFLVLTHSIPGIIISG